MSVRNILTLVLAGGSGTRLQPLTRKRCKPGVPFGGNFRIIDFTLMNCVLSGLREVHVLTRQRPAVLIRHFRRRWRSLSRQFTLRALPPRDGERYAGTADAVYKNLELLRLRRPEVVLVLSGDHLYRADYRPLVEEHLARKADATVLTDDVAATAASAFGVLENSPDRRIRRFVEKPRDPLAQAGNGKCSINLGVYCFRPEFLVERLCADAGDDSSAHDFGKNVLPTIAELGRAISCPLAAVSPDERPYWRDIGTLDSYFEASLDLVGGPEGFTLADERWPPRSPFWSWLPVSRPAVARIGGRRIEGRNVVSTSAQTSGANIVNTILSPGVEVGAGAELVECVVLPGARVGTGARLRRVIVEENIWVLPGTDVGPSFDGDTSSGVRVLTDPSENASGALAMGSSGDSPVLLSDCQDRSLLSENELLYRARRDGSRTSHRKADHRASRRKDRHRLSSLRRNHGGDRDSDREPGEIETGRRI